jgi:hypothetical protein
MNTKTIAALAWGLAAAGCGSAQSNEPAGTASLAIDSPPQDGTCIQVVVAGSRTVSRFFDVAPGAYSVFTLDGLPLGPDTFTASAYGGACSGVSGASVANWVSDPVVAYVTVSPPVSVTLAMHRNGNAGVTVTFPDDPDAGPPTGPYCLAPTTLCGAVCVDLNVDPANCGACGHGCLGGGCRSGACQPVVIAPTQSGGLLAVDPAFVYWVSSGGGGGAASIVAAPASGGAPATLATGLTRVFSLVVEGPNLYFPGAVGATQGVFQLPNSGGIPAAVVSAPIGASALAVDATNVYYVSSGSIMKAPIAGGSPSIVANTQGGVFALSVDATSVYWVQSPTSIPGKVSKTPIGGGASTVLASGQTRIFALALDAANVYWTDFDQALVVQESISGGPQVVVASGQQGVGDIAVDATSVYWAASNVVLRAPIGGGPAVTLATSVNPVAHIAVDAAAVYWTDIGGALLKVAKP